MQKILLLFFLFIFSFCANANMTEGLKAYQKGNYSLAYKYFFQAADKGDSKAAYYLGLMHKAGCGAKKSTDLALQFLKLAARKGNPKMQYHLGIFYWQSIGFSSRYSMLYPKERDNFSHQFNKKQVGEVAFAKNIEHFKQAKHYFELAAKGNITEAIYHLALANYVESILLYKKANIRRSYTNYADIVEKPILQLKQRAFKLLEKAGNKGSVAALNFLGDYYYYGRPFGSKEKNSYEALLTYHKALQHNKDDAYALYQIGQIKWKGGYLVKEDKKKSLTYYTRSAKEGFLLSQKKLALSYLKGGKGINKNGPLAYAWYATFMQGRYPHHAIKTPKAFFRGAMAISEKEEIQIETLAKQYIASYAYKNPSFSCKALFVKMQ